MMPSNFATLAPSGRVMAAAPPNLASMAEAGRGGSYLCRQVVLAAGKVGVSLNACIRRRICRYRFRGRRRDQGCCRKGDNRAR